MVDQLRELASLTHVCLTPATCACSKKKAIAEESDSDHGDFDPNALREHEEFTKARHQGMSAFHFQAASTRNRKLHCLVHQSCGLHLCTVQLLRPAS